jgi:2-polyprenyl-3-methyl-5-hydroxy-6-metoxy-1,4-benzoquinol methylase
MKHPALDKFPKKRAALPPEFEAIYETHYKKNRQGATKATSLSMKLERWLHVEVARDVQDQSCSNLQTLEIGAGMLNQLPYEPYITNYDIVEPFAELYHESSQLSRVRTIYADISEIPAEIRYDRITSVATFEHIMNLPDVVAKAVTLLKENGSFRVAIPNEGTIFWKLGTFITGYEFKRSYGLDYQILMKFEHVNTANEIEAVLKYFFNTTSTKVFGINRRLAFYRFIECTNPDIEKAVQYLENIK